MAVDGIIRSAAAYNIISSVAAGNIIRAADSSSRSAAAGS